MTINKTHINQCSDFTTSAKSALFKTFEEAGGGGSTEPAGEDRELQLNDNGAFGGAKVLVGTDSSLGVDLSVVSLPSSAAALGVQLPSTKAYYAAVGDNYFSGEGSLGYFSLGYTMAGLGVRQPTWESEHSIATSGASVNFTGEDGISTLLCADDELILNYEPAGAEEDSIITLSSVGVRITAPTLRAMCPLTPREYSVSGGLNPLPTLTSGAVHLAAIAFASNGRKEGEGEGAGTGCPVWWDGSNWLTFYDNSVVQD